MEDGIPDEISPVQTLESNLLLHLSRTSSRVEKRPCEWAFSLDQGCGWDDRGFKRQNCLK